MRMLLLGVSALALAVIDGSSQAVFAQTTPQAEELRPITVRAARRKPVVRRVVAPRVQAAPAPVVAEPENPRGSFPGYAANSSASGTKTTTPLNEIPQSISVVGKDQIRDQKPQKLDEIVRYTPGIRGETFGADSRNDWFQIRGFPAQQDGYFLDGLPLFNTAYATWKLQPFGLERLEVLRGPTVFNNRVLTQEQVGVYLQDQIKYDRFTLIVGGRNDWVDLKSDNRIGPSLARSDSKSSGRVGLIYNGDFGISPYVSYATSYNPIIGTNSITGKLFDPETG